jgi:hypothetical protein
MVCTVVVKRIGFASYKSPSRRTKRIAQRTIETLRANALTRDDKGKVPPTDTTCSGYVDQRFATNEQSGFAAYGD